MKIIGLTGKSGSGKTTLASLLSKKINCKHVDIDKIGHEALLQEDVITKLCNKFGTEILNENGQVDRKRLGNIVFSKKDKMKQLEEITWKYMEETIDNILLKDNENIVLDWILLPQCKYWDKCDLKILVESDYVQRKNKVLERDNISEDYFNKRDLASIDYSIFEFDYILKNDYNPKTMNKMLENLFK